MSAPAQSFLRFKRFALVLLLFQTTDEMKIVARPFVRTAFRTATLLALCVASDPDLKSNRPSPSPSWSTKKMSLVRSTTRTAGCRRRRRRRRRVRPAAADARLWPPPIVSADAGDLARSRAAGRPRARAAPVRVFPRAERRLVAGATSSADESN